MCIAIYKPKNQKMPSNKIIKTCFENNSHGAGYMFAYNGKVYIEKGFMSLEDLKKSLKANDKLYDFKSLPVVLHFRISTQGGVQKGLCHPFPISNSYDDMKKTSNICDIAAAHNGIIDFASNYGVLDHNDTMEFIKNVAYPQINNDLKWYNDKKTKDLFKYLLSGNRFVILGGNGHAELIGNWERDNGIYYSNTTYKASKIKYVKYDLSKFYDDDYDCYYRKFATGNYNYNKGYEIKDDTKLGDDVLTSFTKQNIAQKGELQSYGTIFCEDCGEDTFIYYDYTDKKYKAFCYGCGKEYVLDDDIGEYAKSLGLVDMYQDDNFVNDSNSDASIEAAIVRN